MHRFADDTNQNFNISVKSINKQGDHDLKHLANWLKANVGYFLMLIKLSFELMLFISPKRHVGSNLKIKRNGKRLCETNSV